MEKIVNKIVEKKNVLKIDDNCIEILTNAEIEKGVPVKVYIKKVDGKIILCDDKNTLRFMSKRYELKAPDVKQCINDVVKFYNFKIDKGEVLAELKPSDDYTKRYNDLIICSCTLANMYIFFDSPK